MKNNLNTFRHWIFDLDGTLADTANDIVESLADTCEQVLGNRPEMDSSWIGPPLPDMIRRIDPAISQERITQIVLLFREKYFSSAFPSTRLYPGISDLLSHLQQQGHSLYVATNKSLRLANSVLAKEGILANFQSVWTSDAMGKNLTKNQMVKMLLDAHEIPCRETVLVGDNPMDIQAAIMHNIYAVAAGWGYGSRESLEAQNPDFYCNTVQELAEWVRTR